MKFNEDILKAFNLEAETVHEPVNVMKIGELLDFMKACAERIDQKSKRYISCDDADVQLDCIDIVTAKLNDFAQVFMDLVIFLRKSEGTYKGGKSLRYCMTAFDSFEFVQTEQEALFLQELLLRNEITHDYFNRELHQKKLIGMMENCSGGAIDVYKNLYAYCAEHNLMNQYADRNA